MKSILIIAALVVLGGLIYFGFKSTNKQANLPATNTQSANPTSQPVSAIKEFTVEGKPFEFNPKEIKVKKGDTVKITFKNNEGFHSLTIDDYNAGTKQINAGESDTIQFVADKAGSFQYFCAVDSHKDKGMVGTLVVE